MEYLMTYGWAILIIAVVLGALFGLGFFNAANLAPKIAAGGCTVQRPNGPGTTSYINTEGTCNNELPQYTAQFPVGGTGNIMITNLQATSTTGDTVTFWMYLRTTPTSTPSPAFSFGSGNYIGLGGSYFGPGGTYGATPSTLFNTWSFIALSFTGTAGNTIEYVNGVPVGTGSSPAFSVGPTAYIGGYGTVGSGDTFNGLIGNVQLYNTSLSGNQITALYQEGLGGVPLNLRFLVAWWQLNGNANDYGGNQYNGAPSGVTFTSGWTTGYTAP